MAFVPKNLHELSNRCLPTRSAAIDWLREMGLLAAAAPACTTPDCTGDVYEGAYSRGIDGRAWRCHGCRAVINIRRDSLFDRSKASLSQLVRAMYLIAMETPSKAVMREAELASATVASWGNLIRYIMTEDMLRHPEKLGGPGVAVHIDEPLVSQAEPARSGKARAAPQQELFGMTDESGRCHVQLVPDRTPDTLLAVVEGHVLPGSEIWSGQWAGYAGRLAAAGFIHRAVYPLEEAGSGDGVHTNAAEGMWSTVKSQLKRIRVSRRRLLPSYLDEFMWRRRHGRQDAFREILRAVAEQCPVR